MKRRLLAGRAPLDAMPMIFRFQYFGAGRRGLMVALAGTLLTLAGCAQLEPVSSSLNDAGAPALSNRVTRPRPLQAAGVAAQRASVTLGDEPLPGRATGDDVPSSTAVRACGSTFQQTGMASWYGKRFNGRRTASGERYDMRALTAAHRTLPLGACVRVTAVGSARSVIVRINDRGPFVQGRVIDLSYAAARLLGFGMAGNAQVTLERLAAVPVCPEGRGT